MVAEAMPAWRRSGIAWLPAAPGRCDGWRRVVTDPRLGKLRGLIAGQ